jgi:hypothetical protein
MVLRSNDLAAVLQQVCHGRGIPEIHLASGDFFHQFLRRLDSSSASSIGSGSILLVNLCCLKDLAEKEKGHNGFSV